MELYKPRFLREYKVSRRASAFVCSGCDAVIITGARRGHLDRARRGAGHLDRGAGRVGSFWPGRWRGFSVTSINYYAASSLLLMSHNVRFHSNKVFLATVRINFVITEKAMTYTNSSIKYHTLVIIDSSPFFLRIQVHDLSVDDAWRVGMMRASKTT